MTRDAEKAFKIIYCEYKRCRKAGASRDSAMTFESGSIEKLDAFSDWNPSDIASALSELRQCAYIKTDILGTRRITPAGLEFMESRPKRFFEDLSNLFDIANLFT